MEVKRIPEHLYIPNDLSSVVSGDRIVYHLIGDAQVKYFDVATLENGNLLDCVRSMYLDASPDYVVSGENCEALLLNTKTGQVSHLNDSYGKILNGEIYTIRKNPNRVYNPGTGVVYEAKGPWDFQPEKICGNKIYGAVHGVVSERDAKVLYIKTGSIRNLFKYFNCNDLRNKVSNSDGYWVLADQEDRYNHPLVIRAVDLETSEVRKIASFPPNYKMSIIGVINNWFYYRTREEISKGNGESETILHIYKISLANPEQCEEIT